MGDMADYYKEDMYDAEIITHNDSVKASNLLELYKIGVLDWPRKDGDPIPVTEMTNEHISNAKAFMEKSNTPTAVTEMWVTIFGYELKKRIV